MKDSGRSIFFSEKIMDRLNAIVRFVLSFGNMSNILHGNKKTGLCREKISRPKNIFLPCINIKWSLPAGKMPKYIRPLIQNSKRKYLRPATIFLSKSLRFLKM